MPDPTDPPPADPTLDLVALGDEPYLSLTTYRRSGVPVPTPVWAACDGDRLVVWTGADSGKVKRLRHTSRVTIAPCDVRGRLHGDPVPASARVLDAAEMDRVGAALTRKYGWKFRGSVLGARLGRLVGIRRVGQVGIEIVLD